MDADTLSLEVLKAVGCCTCQSDAVKALVLSAATHLKQVIDNAGLPPLPGPLPPPEPPPGG